MHLAARKSLGGMLSNAAPIHTSMSLRRAHSIFSWDTSPQSRTGLAGVPNLHTPSDFPKALTNAIKRIEALRKELSSTQCALVATQILDEMSDEICRVSDVCDMLKEIHPDGEIRKAARETHANASVFVQELNTDVALYNDFVLALDRKSRGGSFETKSFGDLNIEQKYTAGLLRADFEKSGIHLDSKIRSKFVDIYSKVVEYENSFQHSMATNTSSVVLREDEYKILGRALTPENGVSVSAHDSRNKTYKVTAHSDFFYSLVRYCHGSDLRLKMYQASHTASPSLLQNLDNMLECRYEMAKILGYPSFGHFGAEQRMIKSPEKVFAFLETYADYIKPKADEEISVLSKIKARTESDPKIYEWDFLHTKDILMKESAEVKSIEDFNFVDFEKILCGFQFISKTLYSLNIVETPTAPGESWHSDVKKMCFYNKNGNLMGSLYMDLFSRDNKTDFAGLFICQASRKNRKMERIPAVLSMVCNFPKYNANKRVVISRRNAETLFHEFGHCLHNILCETQFQHTSGTRCPIDFVEIPSTLTQMLPFRTPEFKPFIFSPVTQENISDSTLEMIKSYRPPTQFYEKQDQLLKSMVDLVYHGPRPLVSSTTEIYQTLQDKHTSIPSTPGTNPQGRFRHLVHYASGYYSYLCADVVSQEIWEELFEKNPMNPDSGKVFAEKLLRYGGGKPPKEILVDLLGDRMKENRHLHALLG